MNEHKYLCDLCESCKNFDSSDRYCKLLQINWLPEDFGCNKHTHYKENKE